MGSRSAPLLKSCRQATLSQIEDRFAPCVSHDLLRQNATKDFSRERVYTLTRTFWCWIWQILQGNTSCREVVRQLQALFALTGGLTLQHPTGAYCIARSKLSMALLNKVFQNSLGFCQKSAPAWTILQKRPLRVFDGSGLRLQDTPQNRHAYPPSSSLVPGTGFPYLKLSALFCLGTGAVLARVISNSGVSERSHLLEAGKALRKGDILIADRAYGLFVFAAVLQSWGVDLLARVATGCREIDYRSAVKKLGPCDALFTWKKPKPSKLVPAEQWAAFPEQITVRVIRHRVTQKGFRTRELTIVTTLLDPVQYPREEILEGYLRRWRMEVCLDDLKTTLGMEKLQCLTPDMVQKEALIFLIAHNLIRWLMLQAAALERVKLEAISFKGSLDAFGQWSQAMARTKGWTKGKRAQLWEKLLKTLAADKVPLRPNRQEPRAVKKRSKYPHLNRARSQYKQERLSRNQRRREATKKRRSNLI